MTDSSTSKDPMAEEKPTAQAFTKSANQIVWLTILLGGFGVAAAGALLFIIDRINPPDKLKMFSGILEHENPTLGPKLIVIINKD